MKINFLAATLAALLGTGFAVSAFAQAKPDQLVKQRQAKMTLQGKYFGPLALMAAGKIPYNGEVAARNAAFLEPLSRMAWDGFDPSTSGEKSNALPVIYQEPAKFRQAQEAMESSVTKLVSATKSGNEANVKAAAADVGKACGSCHNDFRAKQQ